MKSRLQARIDLLNRAVAIDPQFAEAYSEIANAYYFLGAYGDRSALARGVDAANSALKIDPELASGYRGLALNLNEIGPAARSTARLSQGRHPQSQLRRWFAGFRPWSERPPGGTTSRSCTPSGHVG